MRGVPDIELLAPAGALETALAAFAAGADAVYLGLDAFSARAEAVNFTTDQLRQLLAVARPQGKKAYVTFNTLIDDAELPTAVEKLAILDELQPDGLIVLHGLENQNVSLQKCELLRYGANGFFLISHDMYLMSTKMYKKLGWRGV